MNEERIMFRVSWRFTKNESLGLVLCSTPTEMNAVPGGVFLAPTADTLEILQGWPQSIDPAVLGEPECKSGRAGFGHKFVKIFLAYFGPAYKIFSQRRTFSSPVAVEAIELIKSSMKIAD